MPSLKYRQENENENMLMDDTNMDVFVPTDT